MSPAIERIEAGGELIALIVRRRMDPAETTFVTSSEAALQVGFIVYPAGGAVARHTHRLVERTIVGTSEVLVVRSGRCTVDLYDGAREPVGSRDLEAGDVIVLVAGGHGFRMNADTVLLEVKQGPYAGVDEKERF